MFNNKPNKPLQPRQAWWFRTDIFIALQIILVVILIRLVIFARESTDPAQREVPALFVTKFAALMLISLCLAVQILGGP